jgi:threonine/homoserine/homoserine lactone efflux protein
VALSAVIAFWGTSFLLVVTPGADWAHMITAGLRNQSVLLAASGLLLGYLGLTTVVAAGVAALVASTPVLLTALTVLGASYLIWLGASGLAHPAEPATGLAETSRLSWSRQTLKGAGISGLNPKALLLFVALLPQFTSAASQWPLTVQIMVLGLVHTCSCAVVYSGVGVGARVVLSTRPSLARGVSRFSGATMLAIGMMLVLHQLAG